MTNTTAPQDQPINTNLRRLALLCLLSWLAMLGVDFFLHGGLLAAFWVQDSPFLLPPAQAFSLIPVGYAAFLLLAVLLIWLMTRLEITGWGPGFIFGLKLGALVWGALVLGLNSATTAGLPLLLSWFVGQTLEMAVGGAVIGRALGGERLSRLFLIVLGLVVLFFVITIVMQSLGLAPTVRMNPA